MHVVPIPLARRFQRSKDLPELHTPVQTPPAEISGLLVAEPRYAATRRIEGLGLGSVAATAAVLFGALFAAVSMGILALWIAASATGTVGQFEGFMRSIGFRDFAVSGTRIVLGLLVVAAAFTLLATALAVIAAGLYNVLAATGHGLRVRITPDDEVAGMGYVPGDSSHAA